MRKFESKIPDEKNPIWTKVANLSNEAEHGTINHTRGYSIHRRFEKCITSRYPRHRGCKQGTLAEILALKVVNPNTQWVSSTLTWTMELEVNDQFRLRLNQGIIFTNGMTWINFSGYLIREHA